MLVTTCRAALLWQRPRFVSLPEVRQVLLPPMHRRPDAECLMKAPRSFIEIANLCRLPQARSPLPFYRLGQPARLSPPTDRGFPDLQQPGHTCPRQQPVRPTGSAVPPTTWPNTCDGASESPTRRDAAESRSACRTPSSDACPGSPGRTPRTCPGAAAPQPASPRSMRVFKLPSDGRRLRKCYWRD